MAYAHVTAGVVPRHPGASIAGHYSCAVPNIGRYRDGGGGGGSLSFALPPMCSMVYAGSGVPGITVVFFPIISLQRD